MMICVSTATERAALNAGTVGFDRNIFSGNPSLDDLKGYSIKASPEEQCKKNYTILISVLLSC